MRSILHCDANNFYASVECLLDSSLKGKAVAVSGNPDKRHGIILAKNELAKKFGIKTGEVIWQAKQKCPDLILVAPQYDKYVQISDKLFEIYSSYTDRVEPFGIDECWLDVTGSKRLFGSGEQIAERLRQQVKDEIGITISVGVSFNKIFAKLGSDIKKPDAVTIIDKDNFKDKVWKLPVSDMLMIGRKTGQKLESIGINTIGDLACCNKNVLSEMFGINGIKMHENANGINDDEVRLCYQSEQPKSIGNSTTMPKDITTREEAQAVILALCEMISTRLRQHNLKAKGVYLGVKTNNLESNGKQTKLPIATSNANKICEAAMMIFDNLAKLQELPIRALSVATFGFDKQSDYEQLSLFDENVDYKRLDSIDKTIDQLRLKYGYSVVKTALVISQPFICEDLETSDFLPFKK